MNSAISAVRKTLNVLRSCYANREGQPHQLNEVQITVYLDGLSPFTPEELEAAARKWMASSPFFPRLSDLRHLLTPAVDADVLANQAWARLENDLRKVGTYRAVTFLDPVFGEAVRQTFGDWASAGNFQIDSPGWAIRRQTFISAFKSSLLRTDLPPTVTLSGRHHDRAPVVLPLLDGMPSRPHLCSGDMDRSAEVMAQIGKRVPPQAATAVRTVKDSVENP
jgi:hypothetical protein